MPMKAMIKVAIFSILAIAFDGAAAGAHEFWAGILGPEVDGRYVLFAGWGDGFPANEGAEGLDGLAKPRLAGPGGELELTPAEACGEYATSEPLGAGTYVAQVNDKARFFGRTESGWIEKSKAEDPAVTRCNYGGHFGKAVLNVGGAGDPKSAGAVLGHKLEIIPLNDPAAIEAGRPFPLKVLYDVEPAQNLKVEAYFAGLTPDNSAMAFSRQTDADGLVELIPLKAGLWLAMATREAPYGDQAVCDKEIFSATLAFEIAGD